MGPLSAVNHLLNLVAPALSMAVLLVLGCQVFLRKRAAARSMLAQLAINFVVGAAVVVVGMVLLGRDGKMLTYAALALAGATTQWVLLRGWR
ncbi:MAG: hypothetical protein EOO32_02605 [Comamonadaceae bacterium]|nr:MAG: hypothetical protein EOO32_02605 [Comamonadaceae bacterium]